MRAFRRKGFRVEEPVPTGSRVLPAAIVLHCYCYLVLHCCYNDSVGHTLLPLPLLLLLLLLTMAVLPTSHRLALRVSCDRVRVKASRVSEVFTLQSGKGIRAQGRHRVSEYSGRTT